MRVRFSLIPRILRQGLTVTAAAAIGPALAIGTSPASAAARPAASFSFTVNSTADSHDVKPGDGKCADSLGRCTLRAAIEEAGADPAGSTISISVPAGTYQLSLGSLSESANTIAVTGSGAPSTTIKAAGAFRVLQVGAKATATWTGVTITGGNGGGSGYGGGVLNSGTMTISGSSIVSNTSAVGGGIANSGGKLTISGSTVSGNTATVYGGAGIQNGGLNNLPGTVKVTSSNISNNTASGDGGGILNGQNGHPAAPGRAAGPRISHTVRQATPPARDAAPQARPAVAGLILTVTNSKINNNSSDNAGGAIANDGGTATVTGSTVSGNTVPHAIGGGIETYGPLTVSRSTLSGNSASGGSGGGIDAYYGQVPGSTTITQSTLKGNSAQIGAGIDVSTTVNINQSTLSGNKATQAGGGIEVEGTTALTITNSTITANTALTTGGGGIETYACGGGTVSYSTITGNSTGLYLSCSTMQLTGTIVASSTSGNCIGFAPAESAGYNLDSGTSCRFSKPTDLNSTNPVLGALGNNGGPTQTELPLTGSPAIDHGGTLSTGCPPVDQRGDPRPSGPACDIGSVEVQQG